MYVLLADKLLRKIPGPHLEVMDSWPTWSRRKSPPLQGGLYLNPKWKPPGTKKVRPPKPPPAQVAAISGGPTSMEIPVVLEDAPKSLPSVEQPALLEGAPLSSHGSVKNAAPAGLLESSGSVHVAAILDAVEPNVDISARPMIEPQYDEEFDSEDAYSSISSEEPMLKMADPFAAIKGLRPDPAIEQEGNSIQTTGGMVKHVAIMGGKSP